MPELQTAEGRRIFYDTEGEGAPVLLLMGAGESRKLWVRQIAALAPSFQVITMDHRDCGQSEPEVSAYTIADLADDAYALVQELGLRQVDVVGTSMGSMVALQLALSHPASVGRLVLLAPPAGGLQLSAPPSEAWSPDHADWMRGMFPMLAAPGYFDAHPEVLREAIAAGQDNRLTYDGVVRQIAAMGAFDVRGQLATISNPTLVVHGDSDPLIPLADVQAVAEALPHAQLRVVAGAGHLAFLEQARAVNDLLLGFLGTEQPSDTLHH